MSDKPAENPENPSPDAERHSSEPEARAPVPSSPDEPRSDAAGSTPPSDPLEAANPHESPGDGETEEPTLDRRALLLGGSIAALAFVGYAYVRQSLRPRASVFIARNQTYSGDLKRTIADGLLATGFKPEEMQGRKVLLKPNFVEPNRKVPHMTTHPAVILAAAEVFRGWGATVTVGEAPGHMRDTEAILAEAQAAEPLADAGLPYVDLNYDDTGWVKNTSKISPLRGLFFPKTALEADLIVSLPKLKTHHWVGVTASLKNMYGLLPGIRYGWPKNVLHHAGIPQTVVDINASVKRAVTIIDAIDCMEGDGPIMGSVKPMGLVVVSTNLAAADATCARIMGIEPTAVNYLQLAADRLGPIAEHRIEQRGERWQELVSAFEMLDVPHLQGLRTAELVS